MSMFNLSRYWNRCVYKLVDIARFLLWDKTGMNGDILGDDFASDYVREVMTTAYYPKPQVNKEMER